ncbi:MAG: hypothetical protein JXB49_14620 [Bacteroidales bacterium]|nr:hypothetical protein [Bacteroidales bacterium]MBN2820494.1 hypothetical protein [Bacteroidales bacterium]
MKRVGKTKLFYYDRFFELTARLDYKLILNDSIWILDPVKTATLDELLRQFF